ncbi:MAG: threonine ammonia-lyase [Solirubrobacteraceae bacterium]
MGAAAEARVDGAAIRRAAEAGEGVVRPTPVLSSRTLGARTGGTVALKAENLQRTGSFKLRGAMAKLAALGEEGCAAGVVAASAGNHAQAVAYAARARGVRCEVFIPDDAPIAKAEAAAGLGAEIHHVTGSVDDCVAAARARAGEPGGPAFIHPFDDPVVVAGQGSLGLELLEQVPDLAQVVVPVGGGGLASGTAIAVKSQRPGVRLVGVQVEACPSCRASLDAGEPVTVESRLTIADGIAIKRPGGVTLPLLRQWVDDVVCVGEEATAEAMVLLLQRAKLVVEGAGAVGVAALLGGLVAPAAEGTTVAVLSGGNVDAGLLASIARRHETGQGRRLALLSRVPDTPGGLARLLRLVADTGANVVEVEHVREGVELHVRETGIQLVLETRGREHADRVLAAIREGGYGVEVMR